MMLVNWEHETGISILTLINSHAFGKRKLNKKFITHVQRQNVRFHRENGLYFTRSKHIIWSHLKIKYRIFEIKRNKS
jgi:hypothetical protein